MQRSYVDYIPSAHIYVYMQTEVMWHYWCGYRIDIGHLVTPISIRNQQRASNLCEEFVFCIPLNIMLVLRFFIIMFILID